MKYGFQLNNLTNDKPIALLSAVTNADVERAMQLHGIGINDIGIVIVELEELTGETNTVRTLQEHERIIP